MFCSNATTYAHNSYFLAKFTFLALAGVNMLFFHLHINRGIERWGAAARPPLPARIAGALSLLIWIGVIACGRWVGFSLVTPPLAG
jgi:hypothetical protein